jgi:hypothetical protein
MDNKKTPKNAEIFTCFSCDFKCSKQSDYSRHLLTLKHRRITMDNKKTPQTAIAYSCEFCGQSYKFASGLSKHKKKCGQKADEPIVTTLTIPNSDTDIKHIFVDAMKHMHSQQQVLIEKLNTQQEEIKRKDELMEQMIHRVGNNNTTNNNTNNFNINMFLNETCKNAINFSDFIERIQVSHDDLENNAQLGFVNGMTKILMDNLKRLTIHERPIHCTDVKRETLYIKDQDVWEKDHSTEKISQAIQEVSRKSMRSLIEWKQTNPDYKDMDSEFSQKCIPMQQNSMGLCNKESFYPKIIHNLACENSISHLKKT